jgi:lysyl-tRNA synthetase class 2
MGVVVAPALEGYQFVYDYPLTQAALARRKPGTGFAERFELFHDGVELANGFSELTDADEQRARFEQDNRIRAQRGLPQYDPDEDLLAALEAGLPQCAGAALGLDRLMMVLLGIDSIEQVMTFTR